MSTGSPVEFMLGPAPEDLARADIYAVLARFFYAPADPPLLDMMANSPPLEANESTGEFARAWAGLIAACAATNENAAQDEFDALFVGVGKAPISPYLGAWLPAAVSEHPLVDLHAFLLSQGLARQQAVSEPEDHIAAVYEVMRHLILQPHASMDAQREFFRHTIWPGVPRLCAALQANEHAQLFKAVARLASAFAELENAAFEML